MSTHIIELNGKRYNAITGELLGDSGVTATAAARAQSAVQTGGRVIDGIVRPAKPRHKPAAAHAPASKPKHRPAHPVHHAGTPQKTVKHRTSAGNLRPHHPERPKTLMRSAVKKPHIDPKPAIKVQAPSEVMAAPPSAIVPKASVNQVPAERLSRARRVPQSSYIKRFDVGPVRRPVASQALPPATSPDTYSGSANLPAQAAQPPRQAQQAALAASATPKPATHTDIFEAAIAHATSHQQKPHKIKRGKAHRITNVAAAVAAFLVIGGFVAYLNAPNIKIHVASIRAGFSAHIPEYKPAGYALNGPINSRSGEIRVSFRSGASSFTITQQASDWDSQTLLDNTVALAGGAKQTLQSKGRTIYIYKDHRASWVSGGVRYDISGNASLSPDEIASIAASM